MDMKYSITDIVSFILNDTFKLHNQANGNGYTIEVKGKRKKVSTTDALVDLMFDNTYSIQGDERYQDFIKYVNNIANEERKPFDATWKKFMKMMVQKEIEKKAEYRNEIVKVSIPSAFGAKFTECKFLPRSPINDKDLTILKGLSFCPSSQFFFFEFHGNYTRLGTASELRDQSSSASIRASILITKANSERVGKERWNLWDEAYEDCDKLTSELMDIRLTTETAIKEGLPLDIEIQPFWMNEETTIREFLQLPEMITATDWSDKLHSAVCKAAVNYVLPAVMINKGLGNINFEADGEWFKRYSFRPKGSSKCSLSDYISEVFSEVPALIQRIPTLDEEPRNISDIPGVRCRFNMYKDWMDELPEGQKELKDCLGIKAFLAPYTEEEKLAIMAYPYTVWHPSTNDPINICLKTGGGSFKTNTYMEYTIQLLNYMYRPEGSIVHKMVGDAWVSDPARLENASGDGVSTAALVFNDECTEKSINKFKDMSGGSTDGGVYYQKRIMRENPTEMKIYAKWAFCTNLDFQIQDTEGAFDRRLLLIDRMDIKKLNPPYPRESFVQERRKELKAFYELSEKCYKRVVEKYGSLSSMAVNCREINKNLKQAYNEDSKTLAYYQLWNSIQDMMLGGNSATFIAKRNEDGSVSVAKSSIKSEIEKLSEEYEINQAGFVKWITNTESCTGANRTRITVRVDRDIVNGCRLYPLKDECIPKPDADMNEDKPDVDKVIA
jgi:hypothetical protein